MVVQVVGRKRRCMEGAKVLVDHGGSVLYIGSRQHNATMWLVGARTVCPYSAGSHIRLDSDP